MKYLKFITTLILIFLGNITFAQAVLPTATGTFIAWQSLPSIPTLMSVGTTYQLTYTVKNNNFAPSLPLTISVNHAGGGSIPSIGDNTCQTALAIGHTCGFKVNITPTSNDIAAGIQDMISVSYQGRGSPLTSSINASVNGVTASLTGPSSTQQTTQVSGTTQNLVYTLTNTSTVPITSINISGISAPETVFNQCGSTLAPAVSCFIVVQIATEANNIDTTIPAATLNVDYGGTSNLTKNIAAISVTAPTLAVATVNGSVYTLPSSGLGTGSWSEVSSLGTTDTFNFNSILGLATLNSDEEALNPTLLAAGVNTTTNEKPSVFSINNGASWAATNTFPSAPSQLHIFSQVYDGDQYIMAAGCTSSNDIFCTAAPSFWYTTKGEAQQGTWTLSAFSTATIMTPFAFAYGNGYFVSAMGIFSGGIFSNQKVTYGTSPSSSWTTEDLSIGTGYYPKGLVYANHTWVMVLSKATPGNGLVYYATVSNNSPPTAASWQAATGTFVKNMIGVVYDAVISKFIAVGYDNTNHAYVYTSSDGVTWSSGTEIGSGALQGSFIVTGITYSQSTGAVVIAGYSSSSTNGAVIYNTGSDMSTGWQQMMNITSTGNYPLAIASSTQT